MSERPATPVDAFLASLRGQRVLLAHVPGNHGDALIELGALEAIRRSGTTTTDDPAKAAWIVIGGGGGMNEYWGTQFSRFLAICERWPEKPLAVFPATYRFESDRFARMLAARRAPTRLFARDPRSTTWLRSLPLPKDCEIHQSDDCAFALSTSGLVRDLAARRSSMPRDYVLLVERGDAEHHASTVELRAEIPAVLPDTGLKAKGKRLLRPARQWVRRRRHLKTHAKFQDVPSPEFLAEAKAWIEATHPELSAHRLVAADVSDHYRYTFAEFTDSIAGAAAVVTTRLHAGILAALLGVPTALRDGRYGKLRGVYEASMRSMPHVHLLGAPVEAAELHR